MITLTKAAAEKVKTLMEAEEDRRYLRVYVAGGGCSGLNYGMAFAPESRGGDRVFESNGVPILVDEFSAPYIQGTKIDWKDALMGAGFIIDNPNAETTCSCGQSFATGT